MYQELKIMKWETPQAVDFRFGMEITMYISKR
jgi:coenzyme PQQ precursor peptide PqqA